MIIKLDVFDLSLKDKICYDMEGTNILEDNICDFKC